MKKSITMIGLALAVMFAGSCKKDDLAPVISLTGGPSVTAYKGEVFVDPGATATDDKDGDITSQISVSGTVGTDIGYYDLDYRVNDEAGNFASAHRDVTVKYKNAYLAGTYNVVETSPFGTVTYTGSVTASTSDNTEFVFGSLTAPDPIVVEANIDGLDGISILTVAQGGPVTQFSGTISEPSAGAVTLTLSYLRPINTNTTNCTATWTKQ